MKKRVIALALSIVMLATCLGAGADVLSGNLVPDESPNVAEVPVAEPDSTLYDKLMACKTSDEFKAIAEAAGDEQISALTETELAALEAHYAQIQADAEVTKEEYPIPAVNYTNVAPFLPPVSGGVRMLRAPLAARAAANDAANYTAADNGMKISKTATPNADGSYTITLEAYATGEKVITEQKTDIPTDIILVLDQSGSMDETMSTYDFREYTNRSNSYLYNRRHNGGNANLYYKLDDGSYATVSVSRIRGESVYSYTECQTDWKNYEYYNYENDLYVKIGDGYQKVTLTRTGSIRNRVYTYTFPNGDSFVSHGRRTSPGNFDGNGPLYYRSETAGEYIYTYTYTDKGGVTQTIGTSTGEDTQPTGFTLYERYQTGSKTRLEALKTAVTNFTAEVAKKAAGKDGNINTTEDNINHRIAVVGFASSGEKYNVDAYENTEVFVGATEYTYGESAQSQYGNALQSMDTAAGKNNITSSIGALDAYGGTFTNLGMEMANGIFEKNPIPDGQKRNRVIIVFTDGYPGTGNNVDSTVANNAVSEGYIAKKSTADDGYGATVYTVGIFSGADGTPVESFSGVSDPNKFMHLLSSNYKNAQSYSDSSKYGTATYPAGGGSYYLSAGDADSLNSIFQQISDQIEEGGSSSTLTNEAVVKDIISPQFTLPEGATADSITLETYKYKGPSFDAANAWEKNPNAMGATATIDGDQVSVTGFDFAANYVGTVTENGNVSYRGNKLVISFKVQPKAGFLGGNDVYTNSGAGVYENGSANDPVLSFPRPQVNVPIEDVTVTATDKNVYLKGEVTAAQLKEGATVTVGEGTKAVSLDLSKANENYGLEPWQTEYVNITVTVKDKDGNPISDKLADLTEDTTYTVEVTVEPKTKGTSTPEKGDAATPKTGVSTPADIYVFIPEVTFKDSAIDLGKTPNYADENFDKVVWKHNGVEADSSAMGEPPALTYIYKPDDAAFRADTTVEVTEVRLNDVNVREYADYEYGVCDYNNCAYHGDWKFVVHIKTFDLTIIKSITRNESKLYGSQDFVFNVKCEDKNIDIDVVVNIPDEETQGSVTIKGLPVGTYMITENTGWSWRYKLQGAAKPDGSTGTVVYETGSSSATYTPSGTNNQIIFTNNWVQAKWLSFTDSWKNIFRESNT